MVRVDGEREIRRFLEQGWIGADLRPYRIAPGEVPDAIKRLAALDDLRKTDTAAFLAAFSSPEMRAILERLPRHIEREPLLELSQVGRGIVLTRGNTAWTLDPGAGVAYARRCAVVYRRDGALDDARARERAVKVSAGAWYRVPLDAELAAGITLDQHLARIDGVERAWRGLDLNRPLLEHRPLWARLALEARRLARHTARLLPTLSDPDRARLRDRSIALAKAIGAQRRSLEGRLREAQRDQEAVRNVAVLAGAISTIARTFLTGMGLAHSDLAALASGAAQHLRSAQPTERLT